MAEVIYFDFKNKKRLSSDQAGSPSAPDIFQKLNKDKKKQVEKLLATGKTPLTIRIDATFPGVEIPDGLRNRALDLHISPNYPPHDLLVDDDGISQTLSFSGKEFKCVLPWGCLFYVETSSGLPVAFTESMPYEFRLPFLEKLLKDQASEEQTPPSDPSPHDIV